MTFSRPFPRRASGSEHIQQAKERLSAHKNAQTHNKEDRKVRAAIRKLRLRRAGEMAMVGATAMAMMGPRRMRPYFQQIVALVGVLGSTIALFSGRDK